MFFPIKRISSLFAGAALFMGIFLSVAQAQTVVYSQGFETDSGGYTHSGTYDKWEWGTPSPSKRFGPAAAHNGSRCWGTDLDSNVHGSCDMYLVSPAIRLPAITSNQVLRTRFFSWIQVDYMYDRGEFQVSRDNATWETKAELLHQMLGGWNEYYFNVSEFAGGNIYLRFRCRDDGTNRTDSMAGLYVDDIAIFLADAPPTRTTLRLEAWEDPGASASCPWVYTWNGAEYVKDNDVYSTARGAAKRYIDFYKLREPLVASGGRYLLQLAETDAEESYTDKVRLITVDHRAGTRIAPDATGRIFSYSSPSAPVTAVNNTGSDILSLVSTEDRAGPKLYNGDFVELDFGNQTIAASAIFVLRAQGFLSDSAHGSATTAFRPLLTVQTQDETGVWVERGLFYPRWETSVCAYDLSNALSFSKKIRVIAASCHTNKYHQVDFAGLSVDKSTSCIQTELSPISAIHSNGADVVNRLSASDSDYAYMASNQKISLSFKALKIPRRMVRDFIFVTDGYYVPMGTYFIYTWDGTAWVQRDGWSIENSNSSVDSVRSFDLSLWMPDPAGEYKVRIWQDYYYSTAGIDYVGLTRGATAGNMTSATDLRTGTTITTQLNASDNTKFNWSATRPNRDRWVEVRWNGLTVNTPPTTNPVTITNPTSATPTIGWTYRDAENNPQNQYEVEVWTGPNGTGIIAWDPAVWTNTASSVVYAGSTLVSGQTYYARVKAFDGTSWGAWSEVSWIARLTGTPPIANAGPDQTVPAAAGCAASVTLDGRGSTGTITSYAWTGPFSGTLSGSTPSVTLPLGVSTIILTVTNAFGSSRDTVRITVADMTAPVPDIPTLPTIRGQCSVSLTAPTATDNCLAGVISGVTDSLSFTTQGTRTVRWTFSDGRGNSSTQTQNVIVRDTIAPVPDAAALPDIRSQCSVTLTPPTATDNCVAGVISGVTDSLSFTTQGMRTVRWTFSDGRGNSSTQTQNVIVRDTIAPVPDAAALPDIRSQCSVTLTPPTATDNCVAGVISGATDSLSFATQGTRTVRWTFSDGRGNSSTQTQNVIVRDTLAPVIARQADTSVGISAAYSSAFVNLLPATASDNCTPVTIQPARSDGLPLDSSYGIGTTRVTWQGCDANGNCASVVQNIYVRQNRPPVVQVIPDTTIQEKDSLRVAISASDPDGTVPWILPGSRLPVGCSLIDNRNGTGRLVWNTGCTDHGIDSIRIKAFDGFDSTASEIIVTVTDVNFPPVLNPGVTQYAREQSLLSYTVRAEDCDGITPTLRAINVPEGAQFRDNGDGTGTLLWTPRTGDAGYYMIIFEAKDDATSVRDTVMVVVRDPGSFTPVLTFSTEDTSLGINLPFTFAVRATIPDGTVPQLLAASIPAGSQFICDNAGNAVFSWTPRDSGVFAVKITARHAADTSLSTSRTVNLTVENRNITGPVFLPRTDTIIDQNTDLRLSVRAQDPDGGIPQLYLVSAPPGVGFRDNGDGTGAFSWRPGCDVAGNFVLRAGATDHYFADTISVGVDVRVVNFPPVFSPLPDRNAIAGEVVRIVVSAADRCIGSTVPVLSVSCNLPGYTFETRGDGTATFTWKAWNETGSYPITFYATNGFATSSCTLRLSINKTGTLALTALPRGAAIHVMPAANYPGALLGTDSVRYTARPGSYWFEIQADGFRSVRAPFTIKADSVVSAHIELKPAIPLMFTPPDSLVADTALTSAYAGGFTFVDVNKDGLLDASVISGAGIRVCYGFVTGSDSGFHSISMDTAALCAPISGPVSHVFSDWNNSGEYSCIISTTAGKILLLKPEGGLLNIAETLCTVTGSRPYPTVADVNRDGKKDLVVHSEGVGVFVFDNTGSDSLPKLGPAREITDTAGVPLSRFNGPLLLMNINQTRAAEWAVSSGGALRLFAPDSGVTKLAYVSDLNCGGALLHTDSSRYALIGSPQGQPKLAVVTRSVLELFSTHLCGDVTGDATVDIRDISRISKAWETTDRDPAWAPVYNVKLSGNGPEIIDIRDVSRASKCWELKE